MPGRKKKKRARVRTRLASGDAHRDTRRLLLLLLRTADPIILSARARPHSRQPAPGRTHTRTPAQCNTNMHACTRPRDQAGKMQDLRKIRGVFIPSRAAAADHDRACIRSSVEPTPFLFLRLSMRTETHIYAYTQTHTLLYIYVHTHVCIQTYITSLNTASVVCQFDPGLSSTNHQYRQCTMFLPLDTDLAGRTSCSTHMQQRTQTQIQPPIQTRPSGQARP